MPLRLTSMASIDKLSGTLLISDDQPKMPVNRVATKLVETSREV